ncbi:MAG TPA: hypothetical protein VK722_13485 [Candidatus Aquilonibacter sp.]|jgi:hypothetical protein|nr:hypothetical protein [Candidatus Aquilonibacter sp.]
MSQKILKLIALGSSMLVVTLGTIPQMEAQSQIPYPSMAALDRYLMPDRNTEIALARSAAPDSISHDAKVLVLGPHGYETAVEGKNGFVCAVERGWMAPFDNPEFWNPKIRGPICYNPPAVRSILPMTYKRTEMVLAGQSKDQIREGIATFVKKELPPLEFSALTYMMSKEAYLTDAGGHNMAHLMFYTPLVDKAVWGSDLPKSPALLNPQFALEGIDVFMVLTGMWSDGTLAPVNN